MKEIETYGDLLDALKELNQHQLGQPIQAVKPNGDEGQVQVMLPCIAIGTVKEFEFYACRSTHNNKYCADDVVILMDGNSFNADGVVAWQWNESDEETGKIKETPIYGKNGPTKREDQIAPNSDELFGKWNDMKPIAHIERSVGYIAKSMEGLEGGVPE